MRHQKRGRRLGRSSSHRKAMLKNLASSLFLTEREAEFEDNAPKVKGRVVTTWMKAKEVRPLVEKCITIARHSLKHSKEATSFETSAERGTAEWKKWRSSDQWQKWCAARAPVVAARRRALQLLGDKEAVSILFAEVAPRFEDRHGGYTRILKLARPRLGDAGEQAILELVGVRDRVSVKSEKPAFDSEETPQDEVAQDEAPQAEASQDEDAAVSPEAAAEESTEKKEGTDSES